MTKLSSITSFDALNAGVEIAVAPRLGRLAHRQLAVVAEVAGLPLHGLQVDLRRGDVAVGPRVRSARIQAVERVHHVRQLLEIDLDLLQRVRRGGFVHGRERQDRIADEEHLVLLQDRPLRRRELRHVVGSENAEHARHLQRFRRIDAADLRVRHRAGQQLAEHHAFGAEILGVFRPAGDLCHDVMRLEVLADQFVCHVTPPPPRA